MGHDIEDLSGYLDQALPMEELARVEAHLQGCAQCRAELDELRAAAKLVRDLPQKPLPTGFLQRLENRRRQEAGTEGWTSLLAPRNVAWAACAVTVIFVTYKTVRLYAPMPVSPAADLQPAGRRTAKGKELNVFACRNHRSLGSGYGRPDVLREGAGGLLDRLFPIQAGVPVVEVGEDDRPAGVDDGPGAVGLECGGTVGRGGALCAVAGHQEYLLGHDLP